MLAQTSGAAGGAHWTLELARFFFDNLWHFAGLCVLAGIVAAVRGAPDTRVVAHVHTNEKIITAEES